VLLRRSCHRTLLRCKAGNRKLLPITYERYNNPIRVVQKHGHECIISRLATRNQVGRHGLYPGHYSGIFVAPRTHKTQKPSVSQGLYPILLLAVLRSLASCARNMWARIQCMLPKIATSRRKTGRGKPISAPPRRQVRNPIQQSSRLPS
jgi:hypothetical protein